MPYAPKNQPEGGASKSILLLIQMSPIQDHRPAIIEVDRKRVEAPGSFRSSGFPAIDAVFARRFCAPHSAQTLPSVTREFFRRELNSTMMRFPKAWGRVLSRLSRRARYRQSWPGCASGRARRSTSRMRETCVQIGGVPPLRSPSARRRR